MIIVISGPTAVGKTKLSVELAKIFNGEIINADSMQFYKDLNIGTAKVTPTLTVLTFFCSRSLINKEFYQF